MARLVINGSVGITFKHGKKPLFEKVHPQSAEQQSGNYQDGDYWFWFMWDGQSDSEILSDWGNGPQHMATFPVMSKIEL